MAEEKEKKIIIDEDWKKQAQKEKEELAKKEAEKPQEQQQEQELPRGDFLALVNMLATQTLFALGLLQVEGEKRPADLRIAKYNIEMLDSLNDKTKGNLDQDEQQMLTESINQLRMAFVKVAEQ